MTHYKLLEILCRHKSIINEAYLNDTVLDIPSELIQSGIFRRIGREYKLADTYIQFANTMLKKADIDITFGDYAEEQKKLIDLKSKYLASLDLSYLERIKNLVGKLYERLSDRDTGLSAKVNDIISDNKLSMEAIIQEAEEVDGRIEELIGENENIRLLFNEELMSIENQELRDLLIDIGIEMEILNDNTHAYIQRLNDFILRTKKRKAQNDQLASLSNKIINERDQELDALLLSDTPFFHHTIKYKNSVKFLPKEEHLNKDSFLAALSDALKIETFSRKAPKKTIYKEEEPEEYKGVNLEKVLTDIKEKQPKDIYTFISEHDELKQYTTDKDIQMFSFQVYLTVVLEYSQDVNITDEYNEKNIRIVQWI